MKLDPARKDLGQVVSLLEKLSALAKKAGLKERDWAAETVRTLKAGKLEDYDLAEFARADYESHLAGREDKRPVWDRSRALLSLIDAMSSAGVKSPELEKIGGELRGWSLPS